jgi:hypothetical protein
MPSDAKSPHCLWQGELKRILKCEHYMDIILHFRFDNFCRSYGALAFLAHLAKGNELLPSLGVRRQLTFHILSFSSETSQPNELKFGRKH